MFISAQVHLFREGKKTQIQCDALLHNVKVG